MQLQPAKYKAIYEALLAAFPSEVSLEQMVFFGTGKNLAAITSGDGLQAQVFKLITTSSAENWLPTLLEAAHAANLSDPALAALAAEFRPLVAAQHANPYKVCFMRTNRALVNRKFLRDALRDLAAAAGSRVLLIEGLPQSGKTYSVELMAYLKASLGTFQMAVIDLRSMAGKDITPQYVARRIISLMSLPPETLPPPTEEQDSRWVQYFCDNLVGRLAGTAATWWIVFDGFPLDKRELPDQTHDLIHELSLRIEQHLDQLRMILINYKGELPPAVQSSVPREQISTIGKDDLIDFFTQLVTEHDPQKPLDEAGTKRVAQAVRDVLDAAKDDDPQRLINLNSKVAEVSKSLLGQGGQP